jgi:hypothetical protein
MHWLPRRNVKNLESVTSAQMPLRQTIIIAPQNRRHNFNHFQSLQFNSAITSAMFNMVIIAGEVAQYFSPLCPNLGTQRFWRCSHWRCRMVTAQILVSARSHISQWPILKYIPFCWFSRSSDESFLFQKRRRGHGVSNHHDLVQSTDLHLFALRADSGRRQ